MDGLQEDAGDMQKGIANAMWNDEDHIYPDVMVTQQMFYGSIDYHCTHMTHYHEK